MKIILHIGTEKTGTTSIQEFLNLNQNFLMSQGLYFLQSLGEKNNRKLPAYAVRLQRFDDYHLTHFIKTEQDKLNFQSQVERDLEKEFSKIPKYVHTIIASSEHLHSRVIHQDELENIKTLLSPYVKSIKIVVYLRLQIEMATSLYSTALKFGHVEESLEDFLLKHCKSSNHYYNYDRFLSLWETVFGKENIEVRIFEREFFKQGDLLEDFASLLGFDRKDSILPPKKNESLNPFGQAVLSLCNQYIPRFVDEKGFNQLSTQIHRLVINHCTGEGRLPEKALAIKIQSQFDESNEKVAKRYFPDRHTLFNFDENKYEKQKNLPTSDEVGVIEGLLKIATTSDLNEPHCIPINNKDIDLIRDAALALEKQDLEKAYHLMALANKHRPNGAFIKAKLEGYKKKVKL